MRQRGDLRSPPIRAIRHHCDGQSASERPRHHQPELLSPERVAVRPGPLGHDNVRSCVARCVRPHRVAFSRKNGSCMPATSYARGIVLGISGRRPVSCARRRAGDCAVDIGMAKPHGERRLSTRGDTEDRGSGRQAARRQSASAPIGARPGPRTLVCPQTVRGQRRRRPCSRPVSTRSAAASHRPVGGTDAPSWAADRPPHGRLPTMHTVRHTAAMNLLAAGVDPPRSRCGWATSRNEPRTSIFTPTSRKQRTLDRYATERAPLPLPAHRTRLSTSSTTSDAGPQDS
jgi:hypothetical protein